MKSFLLMALFVSEAIIRDFFSPNYSPETEE